MRRLPLIIAVVLLTPLLTYSQQDTALWLTSKFKKADSVFLISHLPIEGSTDDIIDHDGRPVAKPKLIVHSRVNRVVITEQRVLAGCDIDTLLHILIRPDKDSVINQGGCFVSRQSIIVIKKHKTSFIDICFHCGSYDTSKDLANIPAFDAQRWTELETYFQQHGVAYELDKELP